MPLAHTFRSKLLEKSHFHRQIVRCFANDGRDHHSSNDYRHRTMKERAMAPAGDLAFDSGQAAIAGGALLGLGALGFYGLGISKEPGAIDHAMCVEST
jgi:hypothetical protein